MIIPDDTDVTVGFYFFLFFFCRNLRGMQPCCFIIQKKDKKERQPS